MAARDSRRVEGERMGFVVVKVKYWKGISVYQIDTNRSICTRQLGDGFSS